MHTTVLVTATLDSHRSRLDVKHGKGNNMNQSFRLPSSSARLLHPSSGFTQLSVVTSRC